MRHLIACAVLLLAASPWNAVAAGAEHAAGHADGAGVWVLARHALNLLILVFLLVRFALPALRDLMRQRAENLREQINSAHSALEAAQRELRQLRAQVERAGDETRDLVADAERAADAERLRALDRSRESAQRLRDDARRVADQELQRARGILQAEAAELATELAAQLLRERMGPEDHQRLFDEFAARVGSAT